MANPISHDQNFKNLILDYPHDALTFFAPLEAEGLDQSVTITPLRQEQLKERLGERFRELDVPLRVEWPDGRRDTVLFVLEEETNPRRFSIHRLGHYCLDLSELYDTSRVVPVVIFLHPARNSPESLMLGTELLTYMSFNYLKCELAAVDATQYLDSPNLVARLNLPNMRWSLEQKVDIYGQALKGLLELESDPERQLKYLDFIDIYSDLDDTEMQDYQARYPQESTKMAGLTERLLNEGMQKGMQQGRQEGMQQGMQKGELNVLLRLLTRRFGPLDSATKLRLQEASSEELERWADNILDAASLDEVFAGH